MTYIDPILEWTTQREPPGEDIRYTYYKPSDNQVLYLGSI